MAILNHMVYLSATSLDRIFHALSDGTRRAMLERLQGGEMSIGELAAPFDMSLAGASKHVRVLESAELVSRRISGRTHYCRLEAARLAEAQAWISHYEQFWTKRLDALEAILRDEDEHETGGKRDE